MDPLLDERLRTIEKKLDETYKILAQMRRVQRNANLVKIGYWIVILLLAFVSLYFIKPYISQLGAAYGLVTDTASDDTKSSSGNYSDILKQLQEFQQNQ